MEHRASTVDKVREERGGCAITCEPLVASCLAVPPSSVPPSSAPPQSAVEHAAVERVAVERVAVQRNAVERAADERAAFERAAPSHTGLHPRRRCLAYLFRVASLVQRPLRYQGACSLELRAWCSVRFAIKERALA